MVSVHRCGRSPGPRLPLRGATRSGARLSIQLAALLALALVSCTDRDDGDAGRDAPTERAGREPRPAGQTADRTGRPADPRDRPSVDSTAERARVADRLAAEAAVDGPSVGRGAPDGEAAPGGFHLDDAEVEYEVPRRTATPRKGRRIEIILRSTPPGAVAAVDGVTIGTTPTLWGGVADTTAREFTFVLPGYTVARYRFIPTQDGTVHGTLERLKTDLDAGPPEADPLTASPSR